MDESPAPMEEFTDRLQRLTQALNLVTAALQELSVAIEAANETTSEDYRLAGHPFGRSRAGRAIWRAFGERTTLN